MQTEDTIKGIGSDDVFITIYNYDTDQQLYNAVFPGDSSKTRCIRFSPLDDSSSGMSANVRPISKLYLLLANYVMVIGTRRKAIRLLLFAHGNYQLLTPNTYIFSDGDSSTSVM